MVLTPILIDTIKSPLPMLLFNCSAMSNSLRPHGMEHARLPCNSLSPRTCSNSCPLIESVMPSNRLILCRPLLLLPSVFCRIRFFPNESALCIRWPKYWSFSFNISPSVNIQGWFPLGLAGLIYLQSKEISRVFCNPTVQKHQFFSTQPSLWSQFHIHAWLLEKS